ncbi:MAG: hypothetical protein EON55_23175 [Alphaproteobacteria bacterium]|nr:MAG: hypothetical protein EON55_23175 [Alphaproteobacteria bacterium]
MSNVLIGIIGVILFIGLALAGALFLGPRFSSTSNDAEAARYISEGSQISRAFELYGLNEGKFPDGVGETDTDQNKRILSQMVKKGYLKSVPQGSKNGNPSWYIDSDKGAAMTAIGTGDGNKNVCESARRQAGFTDAIKDCTATDIADKDPCCKIA